MIGVRSLLPTLALVLSLAACGEAPPRPPVPGPEARKAVDAATVAYANCITDNARQAAPGGVPGAVVEDVVKTCAPAREELAKRVMEFHRIGHPKYTEDQLRVVANASIEQIEPQMKADGVAAYITRNSPNQGTD